MRPEHLKAHVRRCRALIGRRDYEAAEEELEAVRQLDPLGETAAELRARLARVRKADARKDVFRNIL